MKKIFNAQKQERENKTKRNKHKKGRGGMIHKRKLTVQRMLIRKGDERIEQKEETLIGLRERENAKNEREEVRIENRMNSEFRGEKGNGGEGVSGTLLVTACLQLCPPNHPVRASALYQPTCHCAVAASSLSLSLSLSANQHTTCLFTANIFINLFPFFSPF